MADHMPTLPSTSSPTDTPTAIGTPQSLSKDDASATIAREQDEIADKDFGWLPIPKRLQYEPFRPLEFSLSMTASFGFGCTFGEQKKVPCSMRYTFLTHSLDSCCESVLLSSDSR